jgi:hypothetical protein
MYDLVMLIVCMWFDKGIVISPPYLAILKILHLLDQRIVLVFQHSLLVVYLLSSYVDITF